MRGWNSGASGKDLVQIWDLRYVLLLFNIISATVVRGCLCLCLCLLDVIQSTIDQRLLGPYISVLAFSSLLGGRGRGRQSPETL